MKRYLGIAALSLALAFGLSISNASATGFALPNLEEIVAESEATWVNIEEQKVGKQYRVLETMEAEEELNFEKASEEAGAVGE